VTQKWCYPPNGRQHEQSNKNGSAANLRRRYAHARQAYKSKLIDQLVELFGLHRKSAIRAFANWLERTLSYLQLPSQWHRCVHNANYLERLFRQLRRRTKLIGSFEQSVHLEQVLLGIVLQSQWMRSFPSNDNPRLTKTQLFERYSHTPA